MHDQAVAELQDCFEDNKQTLDKLLGEAAKLAGDPTGFASWMSRHAGTVLVRQEVERLHEKLTERLYIACKDGDTYENVPQEFLWEVTMQLGDAALEQKVHNLGHIKNKARQNALRWVMDWTKDAIQRNRRVQP